MHPVSWENPRGLILLPQLLAAAADNRRLRASPQAAGLEREIDDLHRALDGQVRGEGGRLHRAKLAALAEFAAGAGHEINNPLAVISGQAQYLLGHAPEWLPGQAEDGPAIKALHTIIGQTRRVHTLLRDLMQFARPAAPAPSWFDLPSLLAEVAASLAETASSRQVRIDLSLPERLQVWADAGQVRTVVTSLLRNAIEAAPADGWARLAIEQTATHTLTVAVEDSGPGPEPSHRPFLFDPFFSGRSAGRGRGLGLPLASRLAILQGGEVLLDSARTTEDGPTRFVLRLPAGPDAASERPAA
jgi:signal transduction histidine kinase